jgi:hypothetical protein
LDGYSVQDLAADQNGRMGALLGDLYKSVAADLDGQGIDGQALISSLKGN